MKMLIMGAPGSGKGTQSESLIKKLNIPAISTGTMLRNAINEGTELGKNAQRYINEGKLVPDDVIIGVVLERLSQKDCKNGYLLDGFPRTLAQAEAMDDAGIDIDIALLIEVSDELIMKRLSGRRVCSCGATYHITSKPSANGEYCEVCGKPLTIRDDDKPETVAKRLKIYHEQTAPVVEYYREKGKLIAVRTEYGVDETTKLVLEAISRGQGYDKD